MSTAKKDLVVKKQRHCRKQGARKSNHPLRGNRHLVTLSEEELSRREHGWNDRFSLDPPPKLNKVHSPVPAPTLKTVPTPFMKEIKVHSEYPQFGKRGGKRTRKPKKGKLAPLSTPAKTSAEGTQPTREEKLHFKVLKAIDARETLLYQLSALILCTPTLGSQYFPSRPTEPSAPTNAGRQQTRLRGGMALVSIPLNRHGEDIGAMTNAREATKLVQQLSTNLQVAGIQCVEALVEWMLEVGAQAEIPPTFLWRGRNYFLKMVGDLDFAEAELKERGVSLDCFRQQNPLLINPNQKLGRVFAAHSIIMEMVEYANDMTPESLLALSKRISDSRHKEIETSEKVEMYAKLRADLGASNDSGFAHSFQTMESEYNSFTSNQVFEHDSTAELVNLLDESFEYSQTNTISGKDNSNKNVRPVARTDASDSMKKNNDKPVNVQVNDDHFYIHDDDHDEDQGNHEALTPSVSDTDTTKETSGALSNCADNHEDPEYVNDRTNSEDVWSKIQQDKLALTHDSAYRIATARHPKTSDSVGEDGEGKISDDVEQTVFYAASNKTSDRSYALEESSQDSAAGMAAESPVEPFAQSENPLTDSIDATEDVNTFEEDNSKNGMGDRIERLSGSVDTGDATSTLPSTREVLEIKLSESRDSSDQLSERLMSELQRWTSLEVESRSDEVNALERLAWSDNRTLTEVLQQHSAIDKCMESSIISLLEQYGLAVPGAPLESLLRSDVGQELNLATYLFNECFVVLGDICSVVAEAILHSLRIENSLTTEIKFEDVLKAAKAVHEEYVNSTWEYLNIASVLSVFLHFTPKFELQATVSTELSNLVKVFYPYLVSQPREKLSDNWHSVKKIFEAMKLSIDSLCHMLDPMSKALLLVVESYSPSSQKSQLEDDPAVFPKVTVICDRDDVLQSSAEYVWHNYLQSEKGTSDFSLSPFFKSSFGEKVVNGVFVEEGEGKGPLKEWFELVGTELASKWKRVQTHKVCSEPDLVQVTVSGNKVTIPGASDEICPGYQLQWETVEGEIIRCVVNKKIENDTFLLDRIVSAYSFASSQLHVSQPRAAVFEYVLGSECYWLNENLCDSVETQNLLVFIGWFLASAILHFSTIQLPIHPLFFSLLLNPHYCVSLEELKLFDPHLFNAMSRLKDMKPTDFAEYLRLENANESLSVDAFIKEMIIAKFGPESGIGWQLQCLRHGFHRVISTEQLNRVDFGVADLVESICGKSVGSDNFVMNDIFRVVADAEFTSCEPLTRIFWQTINGLKPQLKREFIKFVTGVEALPVAGTEFLRIEMPFATNSDADLNNCLQMLPQAHTCDNILELPHYWKALCWREQHYELEANAELEKKLAILLEKKLLDAVKYTSGYGLDSTSAVRGMLTQKSGFELVKEESYDSLCLPVLSEGQGVADLSQGMPLSTYSLDRGVTELASEHPDVRTQSSPSPDESYEEYEWEEESVV